MKRRWQRALGLCCVLLLSSARLGAQTYFASFTGTTISSDAPSGSRLSLDGACSADASITSGPSDRGGRLPFAEP